MADRAADRQPADSAPILIPHERRFIVMVGVILGMLLAALDQTVVGTALPRIVADLNGLNHYSWVVTAYLLASTVTVPIYGKLSDIYGRRPFFILGMVLFLIGSALAGTSHSMTELILYRGVQGLGAGAMMPIAIAIIGDVFTPAERGKWQGLITAVFGLATIIGPLIGGWITDNLGWRWVFYVNMPVGIVAIATAGVALPKMVRKVQHRIDYLGAAALVAGTVPMLLAFSWGGTQYAWGSDVIVGLLVTAGVFLSLFMLIELRAKEPILSPRLFRDRTFAVSSTGSFLLSAGMFGAILYLPLFVQAVVGESATNSGIVLMPMMLGFMFSSIVGGQLMSRTGRYKFLALSGFAVAAIGMFMLSRMDVNATSGDVIKGMVVTGLGIGVMMSLFTIVVQNAFPYRRLGEVTAGITFMRSIGGTIGVAVLGTVMTTRFQANLSADMPGTLRRAIPADRLAQFKDPQILLAPHATDHIRAAFEQFGSQGLVLFHQLLLTIRTALSGAITDLFLVGAIAMLIALFATVFLPEIPLRKTHDEASTAPPQEGEGGPNPEEPAVPARR